MLRVIVLFLMTFLFTLHAENVVITKPGEAFYDFTVHEFINTPEDITFDEIQKHDFHDSTNRLSKGYSTQSYWYRFSVKNETTQTLTYYLQFSEVFLHQVDFYINDNKEITHEVQGVATLEQHDNKTHKPTFKITLEPNDHKEITLKVASKYPVFTNFYLVDKKELYTHAHKYDLFYAFFLGAIFSLILYNISIYLFTKDISYLYYVLYGSSFLVWQLVQTGFWPFSSFEYVNSFYYVSLSIPLMMIFLTRFTQTLLDVKENFPKINQVLTASIYVYLVSLVVGLFDFVIAMTVINGLAFINLPFLIFVGVKSYLNKNKTALFYTIAQTSFIASATLFALAAFGLYEFNTLTRHGIIVGSSIEIVLFSFALAYRIKMHELEKFHITQKANEQLDKKVQERTQELEDSKERLRKLANHDPLTNLYNRRCLFDVSKKIVGLSKREKKPLSLIMFDLDRFKSINDKYGHSMGDSVIISFAWCLKKLRDSDVVARIGGEEFVVILPNTSKEDAFKIAENIRKECEKIKMSVNTHTNIRFTVSGGVATLLHDRDDSIEDIIFRADKRLYEAKRQGRNRIIAEE